MGDLEDFFAKRDKKKKKPSKFEADDIAKILEKKKLESLGKSNYQVSPSDALDTATQFKLQDNEDDEWKEDVEVKPDLTGLKIGELNLEEENYDDEENVDDEGASKKEGPWAVAGKQKNEEKEEVGEETKEEEKLTEKVEETENEKEVEEIPINEEKKEEVVVDEVKNVYIPPALKKKQEEEAARAQSDATTKTKIASSSKDTSAYVAPYKRAAAMQAQPKKPRSKGVAPNLDDNEYFPSLGGS